MWPVNRNVSTRCQNNIIICNNTAYFTHFIESKVDGE